MLAPADNAANNVVVVWGVNYNINILKPELGSSKTYEPNGMGQSNTALKPTFEQNGVNRYILQKKNSSY